MSLTNLTDNITDNLVAITSLDILWLDWYEVHQETHLCRERGMEWSCTLPAHHTGSHVAHFEHSGKVLERWGYRHHPDQNVCEGL